MVLTTTFTTYQSSYEGLRVFISFSTPGIGPYMYSMASLFMSIILNECSMNAKRVLAGDIRQTFASLQCFCAWIIDTAPFCYLFFHVIELFIFTLVLDVSINLSPYFTSTTPALHAPAVTCDKHSIAKRCFFGVNTAVRSNSEQIISEHLFRLAPPSQVKPNFFLQIKLSNYFNDRVRKVLFVCTLCAGYAKVVVHFFSYAQ